MESIDKKADALKAEVGQRARELRKRAGFSSAGAAADAMGMHINTVSALERGEIFLSPEMTLKIVEVYGLPNASPLFTEEAVALTPTPSEALEIIAQALRAPALPAADPRIARLLSAIDANPALLDQIDLVVESAANEPEFGAGSARRRGR